MSAQRKQDWPAAVTPQGALPDESPMSRPGWPLLVCVCILVAAFISAAAHSVGRLQAPMSRHSRLALDAIHHYDGGAWALHKGDLEAARADLESSLRLYRQLEQPAETALVLYRLGQLAQREGDVTSAVARWQESLALYRELGNVRCTAMCQISLQRALEDGALLTSK